MFPIQMTLPLPIDPRMVQRAARLAGALVLVGALLQSLTFAGGVPFGAHGGMRSEASSEQGSSSGLPAGDHADGSGSTPPRNRLPWAAALGALVIGGSTTASTSGSAPTQPGSQPAAVGASSSTTMGPVSDTSTTSLPESTSSTSPQAPTSTTTTPSSTTTAPPQTTTTASPTTTAPPATTTTTSPPGSCNAPASAVVIAAGASIQNAVNNHAAGAVFKLSPGTYTRQTVTPKNGNQFFGCGATLDGQGAVPYAFRGSASNVLIDGVRVINYSRDPAYGATASAPIDGGSGWTVRYSEMSHNGGGGVFARSGWQVIGNHVHHNGQIGILGNGSNIRISGNEINNNNTGNYDPYWEAGGTKFFNTSNLTVDNNRVHNNKGPGLWTDTANANTVYRDNRVWNNTGPGIFHEISCNALIERNTVEGNGSGFTGSLDGAGILIFSSPDVEVRNNVVRNNRHGIAGKHDARHERPTCNQLRNLWVHDNTVAGPGRTGVVAIRNTDSTSLFGSWNNRFDRNTYSGTSGNNWEWAGAPRNWSQWRGYGHDAGGSAS